MTFKKSMSGDQKIPPNSNPEIDWFLKKYNGECSMVNDEFVLVTSQTGKILSREGQVTGCQVPVASPFLQKADCICILR